jgi:hypothetical protein
MRLCEYFKSKVDVRLYREFDDYYAFVLLPENAKPNEKIIVGSSLICVDKKNGEIFSKDILGGRTYRDEGTTKISIK